MPAAVQDGRVRGADSTAEEEENDDDEDDEDADEDNDGDDDEDDEDDEDDDDEDEAGDDDIEDKLDEQDLTSRQTRALHRDRTSPVPAMRFASPEMRRWAEPCSDFRRK